MSLSRVLLTALCICTGVATAQAPCPTDGNFKLHIGSRLQYLEPANPCKGDGCYTYFNTTKSTDYEFAIANGTTHLVLSNVPADSPARVGLYADTRPDPDHPVLDVILTSSPPTNMRCHIRPAPSDDDTCDLVCLGDYKGNVTRGSTILLGRAAHDQWALGHFEGGPKIKVKVEYT